MAEGQYQGKLVVTRLDLLDKNILKKFKRVESSWIEFKNNNHSARSSFYGLFWAVSEYLSSIFEGAL